MANNPNWLCGRPLVFGDVEQIKELQRLNDEYEYNESYPCLDTNVKCPNCGHEFDAEGQLFFLIDPQENNSSTSISNTNENSN